ncbi:hypothetical protein [Bacillus litorisediminis]|uniref:hypothetical protein n=1 Tax=Bacillus litorisediminis TaxID=2922713 RepID=UPI001FAE5969|nr:hypothetical protein [Bacillus litorisediminis]
MELNEQFNANHSTEQEDVILPDDFGQEEVAETQIKESAEEVEVEETEAPPQAEEQPTQEEIQALKLKVKYNSQELELDEEKARELAQKGLNYEKAVERAKQEARDQWVAEQGFTWNGKPITTEAEYKQALMEQELMQKYQNQNLPEDVVKELIENRKFREQYEADRKAKEQQEKSNAEFQDFFAYFRELNGRDFDSAKDKVPQEVWDLNQKGVPLKFAYMQHHTNQLQNQLKVLKQNQENAQRAPIQGVTQHGSQEIAAEDDFLKGFNSI